MIEVLPEVCTDSKVQAMEDYYFPRYGQEFSETAILPAMICYDSKGLQLQSEPDL